MRIRRPGGAVVVLVAVWIVNELIPVLSGTGENARWDWGFLYVTTRWLILPGLAALVSAYAIATLTQRPLELRRVIGVGLTVLVSVCVGLFQWLYQYPLFGATK